MVLIRNSPAKVDPCYPLQMYEAFQSFVCCSC